MSRPMTFDEWSGLIIALFLLGLLLTLILMPIYHLGQDL
jgi:hypothetical protein